MLRASPLLLVFCVLSGAAHAIPLLAPMQSPGEQCRSAIGLAERGHGIPPQLLASIGRVESGKKDPGTGTLGAWPWTINAEGQGYYFDTKAEAIRAVQTLQARGVRSIDVGCMQVNLMHHPTAFPNLDMAFEPAVNADYAARFLLQLHDQAGDWTRATANYHSANPPEGGPYAAKVMSIWPEEQRKASLAPQPLAGPGPPGLFARSAPPNPQPRMYAMAGMMPGKMPIAMMKGDDAQAGQGGIAPPGMMQGGAVPAGTVSSGHPSSGLPPAGPPPPVAAPPVSTLSGFNQSRTAANDMATGQMAGRGLGFYRAMPIMMAPSLPIVRIMNRITTR